MRAKRVATDAMNYLHVDLTGHLIPNPTWITVTRQSGNPYPRCPHNQPVLFSPLHSTYSPLTVEYPLHLKVAMPRQKYTNTPIEAIHEVCP